VWEETEMHSEGTSSAVDGRGVRGVRARTAVSPAAAAAAAAAGVEARDRAPGRWDGILPSGRVAWEPVPDSSASEGGFCSHARTSESAHDARNARAM
jgi:hypothetical protein